MANPLDVTLQLQAQGLDTATARAKAYSEQIAEVVRRADLLADSIARPAHKQWSDQLEQQTRRAERLSLALRNQQMAVNVLSVGYGKHTAMVGQLNRQYDVMKTKARNAALAADLKTGNIGKHAAEIAALGKEYEGLAQQAKLQELVATHGRLGGAVRMHEQQFAGLKRAGTVAYLGLTGLALGLMRSGFQGTVEAYQLERAWTRMSRQVAAIAIPAIDMLSKTIGKVATWFEKLNGSQQDWILRLGLAVVVAAPLIKIFGTLYGMVKGIGAMIGTWKLAGAMSALSAGGAMGAGAMTALAASAAPGVAAAGGAAAGGGLAAGAAAGGIGSRLAGAGRFALRAALPVAAAVALAESSGDRKHAGEGIGDYYARQRSEGRSRLGAASAVAGQTFAMAGRALGISGPETFTDDEAKKAKKRRDVSPMGTALLGAGESAQAIQEEVLKMGAEKDETWKEVATTMKETLELLKGWGVKIDLPALAPAAG